jgi:hypothetical protein
MLAGPAGTPRDMSADNGRGANAVHGGRSAWTAEVELLAWSLRDGQLSFRHVCRTVPTDVCPHEVALGLAGFHEGEEGAFCHSTSWRCPTAGKLVLTYVSVPDPRPEGRRG